MIVISGMKNRFPFLYTFAFTVIVLSTGPVARAQYNPEKVNKKAAQLYSKAMEQAQGDDFKGGIETLQQTIKVDPGFEDAYLSLAGMYGELKN